MPTPHLDGKHVVFGEILSGKSIIRRVESLPTDSGDKPQRSVVIADSGELSPDDAIASNVKTADAYGDQYEDFPEDEAKPDDPLSAQKILAITSDCKDFGNKAFKAGDIPAALEKYQKGLRYLNEEPDTDNESPETINKLQALRATLNSNSALMNIKLNSWEDAVHAATNALSVSGSSVLDKDRAKALYRRGFAHARLKDEDSAVRDLEDALRLAPDDAAVKSELTAVRKSAAGRLAKEKAAYKKFFE